MDFESQTEKLIQQKKVREAGKAIESTINVKPLVEKAENIEIASHEDAKQALSMSLQARKLKKAIDSKRSEIVRPHVDFQRAVNAFAKEYTAKLEEIENRLKSKLENWIESNKDADHNFTQTMIEVEDGKLTQKEEFEFIVEDFDKIPPAYLVLDEKKVKEAIKMGIRDISGIKILSKQTLTMRVNNG